MAKVKENMTASGVKNESKAIGSCFTDRKMRRFIKEFFM